MYELKMDQEKLTTRKLYPCSFSGCTSVFDRPYRLEQHRFLHINVKPFACNEPNCNKAYTNKSHLDRHINSVHKEHESDILYCCPKCMKKYANRQNLKRHIKQNHIENKKPFTCDICKLYFKKKHQLRAHMYVHNGIKTFSCVLCDKDFISLYEKKKHMRNHKTYECEFCLKIYSRWSDLISHKRKNHPPREYICNDCGKVFKERSQIMRHLRKHTPGAPKALYFCPHENCHRHYTRNSNLKQHIKVKHEGMTFDCLLCEAKLSTKATLKDHIDRHAQSEMVLKPPKTLETGREKRKDENTMKPSSALKLAGIFEKYKSEEAIVTMIEKPALNC